MVRTLEQKSKSGQRHYEYYLIGFVMEGLRGANEATGAA